MKKKLNSKFEYKVKKRWLVILLVIVIVIWAIQFFFDECLNNIDFSSIGSLFTGLAFAVLLFSIYLQQMQMKHQKSEQDLLRFQNYYFQMISSFKSNINSISDHIKQKKTEKTIRTGEKPITKTFHETEIRRGNDVIQQDCFLYLRILNKKVESYHTEQIGVIKQENIGDMLKVIKRLRDKTYNDLFNEMQFVLNFIEENTEDIRNIDFYYGYFYNQISPYLKFILALYYKYDDEFKYKELIDKYKIIGNGEFDNFIIKYEDILGFMEELNIN